MDIGASIILILLLILLLALVVAVFVIAYYLININKEIKKIAKATNESTRSLLEFSELMRAISVPLAVISTFSSIFTKFNKAKRKRGEKNVKK